MIKRVLLFLSLTMLLSSLITVSPGAQGQSKGKGKPAATHHRSVKAKGKKHSKKMASKPKRSKMMPAPRGVVAPPGAGSAGKM